MISSTSFRSGSTLAVKPNPRFAQGIARYEFGKRWVHPRNRSFIDRPPSIKPGEWYRMRGFLGGW